LPSDVARGRNSAYNNCQKLLIITAIFSWVLLVRVVLYLHLAIGRGVEHNGHQRFLFNVYKRFLFLSRFLRFLTFFYFFITFFTSMVCQPSMGRKQTRFSTNILRVLGLSATAQLLVGLCNDFDRWFHGHVSVHWWRWRLVTIHGAIPLALIMQQ